MQIFEELVRIKPKFGVYISYVLVSCYSHQLLHDIRWEEHLRIKIHLVDCGKADPYISYYLLGNVINLVEHTILNHR